MELLTDPESLGSLYYEPIWLFNRRETALDSERDLSGLTVAAGIEGSGNRAVVEHLMDENGLNDADRQVVLIEAGGEQAVELLRSVRSMPLFSRSRPAATSFNP